MSAILAAREEKSPFPHTLPARLVFLGKVLQKFIKKHIIDQEN